MDVLFVANPRDSLAMRALALLASHGLPVYVDGEPAPCPNHLKVFLHTIENHRKGVKGYLRVVPYKHTHGSDYPFQVAIYNRADLNPVHPRFPIAHARLRDALLELVRSYHRWHPLSHVAPWRPTWHQLVQGVQPTAFQTWRTEAENYLPQYTPIEHLRYAAPPIFRINRQQQLSEVLILGCASFNREHTSVVEELVPHKAQAAVDGLARIVRAGAFEKATFVLPGEDLLLPELKAHLHPLIFETNESDAARVDAFRRGGMAVRESVCVPLQQQIQTPLIEASWTTVLGTYLSRSRMVSRSDQGIALARSIYEERVRTRPSYASLDTIDPVRNFERTLGNIEMYVAVAYYLQDHPECAAISCEFADTYWQGLAPLLTTTVWKRTDNLPFVALVPPSARQPWGYGD